MRSGLQVGNDLPNLFFTEMGTPGRHDRALRTIRFNGLANLDSPVEISGIGIAIVCLRKIRCSGFEKRSPVATSLTRLTMAGCAFIMEQVMTSIQFCIVHTEPIWHLARRVSDLPAIAAANNKKSYRSDQQQDDSEGAFRPAHSKALISHRIPHPCNSSRTFSTTGSIVSATVAVNSVPISIDSGCTPHTTRLRGAWP